jgi:hypothetical protein
MRPLGLAESGYSAQVGSDAAWRHIIHPDKGAEFKRCTLLVGEAT